MADGETILMSRETIHTSRGEPTKKLSEKKKAKRDLKTIVSNVLPNLHTDITAESGLMWA